jgi:uncharacterized membrane protein
MRDYVAIVFNNASNAYKGLNALWALDSDGAITVHGTAVVHRNEFGELQVDTKETHPGLATAAGVGIGALLGLLAGPAGAAVGAAGGAAIGAGVGGVAGITADLVRADNRDQAGAEARLVIANGQSAVIADVSEDWTAPIDDRMKPLGGVIYRRSKDAVSDDAWYDGPYDPYLYPYPYVPAEYVA